MLNEVRQTIERLAMIRPGDRVVVACSGGPDSTALVHILWRLRGALGIELHVAHLDHRLRGRESREDAEAVADLAVSLGLPVTLGSSDVAGLAHRQGWPKQVAAREARYAFLQRVAIAEGARVVALGHNRDDQAETLVMRLVRGTGVDGLAGIPPLRPMADVEGGLFVRPLLFSSRSEIEAYCLENRLATRQDPSNQRPVYLRNRIRLTVMPRLRRLNPRLDRTLSDIADQAREESVWMEAQAAELLDRMRAPAESGVGAVPDLEAPDLAWSARLLLNLEPLRRAPVALQRRALRLALREAAGRKTPLASATYQQVESLRALALSEAPSGHLDLTLQVKADRQYNLLYLTGQPQAGARMGPKPAEILPAVPLTLSGRTELHGTGFTVHAEVLTGPISPSAMLSGHGYLDLDQLEQPLLLRTRRPGDRFRPLGDAGTRRLKDFLMQARVPARERDRLPLLFSGERLAWVGGLRPAEDFRVTPATRRVLHLTLLRT